ncbi:serine hydroxymethyltransferase [Candidatus Dojkabacteria bacterium]|uniref:Serine hydroxymethyltransferase n=1 Tax=Candidatus Dojkabacteria bacterium TaxID=2099670 RepID=A0A955KZA1_9BACT|nr:serine hydroxymethyltransferase [Candidatus Dojkabacteria bacterium]
MLQKSLKSTDQEVYEILKAEEKKQQEKLSMIPSENFTSKAVREAVGSVFMNKYSEGYPNARYYEGNYHIDKLELLAIERAKKFFKLPKDWEVNVQALSGSPANLSVYIGLLKPGDKIMGMYLPDGGHLSHGWSYNPKKDSAEFVPNIMFYAGGKRKVNVTSKFYEAVQYKTDPKTKLLDYKEIEKIAKKEKPKMIITGGTAYPRDIDYKRMSEIAHSVGAYYLADIAHEAGLVGTGVMNSPVGYADVVTMTTHKTLRCNRGALILARAELMKKINRAIFPGLQGGPHNHSIAGIAVGLKEALTPEFTKYAKQVVKNAQVLAKELQKFDFEIVTGGTDKHLVLIDLTNKGVFGKKYARALDYAGIIANMNTMPQEKRPPADPSALRVGTPWITTRGMKEPEIKQIAKWMNEVMFVIKDWQDMDFAEFNTKVAKHKDIQKIAKEVNTLCMKYPLDI